MRFASVILVSALVLCASHPARSRGLNIYNPVMPELCTAADGIFTGTIEKTVQVAARGSWAISRARIVVDKWIRGKPHDRVLLYYHSRGDGLRGPHFRIPAALARGERVLIFGEHKRAVEHREKTFVWADPASLSPGPKYAFYRSANGRGAGGVFSIDKRSGRLRSNWFPGGNPRTLKEALALIQPYLDRPSPHEGLEARLHHYSRMRYGRDSFSLELRNQGNGSISLDDYAYPDDAFLEVLSSSGKPIMTIEAFGYRRKWRKRKPPSVKDIRKLAPGESTFEILDSLAGRTLRRGLYRVRVRVNRIHRRPHAPGTIFTGRFYSNAVPLRVE